MVLEGSSVFRTAMIITCCPEEVSRRVLYDMERGVTILTGTGAYTGSERPVLYCVVTRAEVSQHQGDRQRGGPQGLHGHRPGPRSPGRRLPRLAPLAPYLCVAAGL